jgi:cytochrome c peroxidase
MGFKTLFSLLALTATLTNGLRTKRATCPDGVNTAVNQQCCFLFPIVEDLKTNLFDNDCGDEAHGALRLIFHDAIGFSPSAGGGGADGSIAVFNATELTFHANTGIDDVLDVVGPFLHKYSNVLTPGDFIQLAGAVSLINCPGAPRIKFSLGRPQPVAASPPNLVPEPFDSVQKILARFKDVGFSPEETVVLISSHSIAGADDVDPSIPGTPFDSTPSVYDSQLFVDVQLRGTSFTGQGGEQGEVESAIEGVLRLQSDHLLARDSATNCIWQSFANNQQKMQSEFGAALFKMSLLGQNPSKMIDCSEVIPTGIPFTGQVRLPPGKSQSDIEQACATASFPVLGVTPGPPTAVPPIPQA